MKEKLSIKRGRGPLDNSGFLGRVEREILILERENEIVWMGRKRNGERVYIMGGKWDRVVYFGDRDRVAGSTKKALIKSPITDVSLFLLLSTIIYFNS